MIKIIFDVTKYIYSKGIISFPQSKSLWSISGRLLEHQLFRETELPVNFPEKRPYVTEFWTSLAIALAIGQDLSNKSSMVRVLTAEPPKDYKP